MWLKSCSSIWRAWVRCLFARCCVRTNFAQSTPAAADLALAAFYLMTIHRTGPSPLGRVMGSVPSFAGDEAAKLALTKPAAAAATSA